MSSQETGSTVMIELLSVGQGPSGYEIEVGLTDDSGYHTTLLELDEYTYSQLNALGPFGSDRIRLSLYPKWDPFRNLYYSTLIRMKPSYSETLYFACSQYYVSQLNKLKAIERRPRLESPEQEGGSAAEMTPSQSRRVNSRADAGRARKNRRLIPIVLLSALIGMLLLVLPWRIDRALSVQNDSDAPAGANQAGQSQPGAPVSGAPAGGQAGEAGAPPPDPASQAPSPGTQESKGAKPPIGVVEEVTIGSNKYTFSLPKGYVALTFDDGPSKYTKELVDILVENGIAGTFMFIGKNTVNHPREARYAFDHGMNIGNHSWDHSKLTANSEAVNQANLAKASQAIQKITGAPVTVFRPPYGAIDGRVSHKAAEQHMKVLLWNRDTEDWRKKSPEDLIHYVHSVEPSGAIFLLHEKKVTVEALPEIIHYLKSKNLKFVVFK